MFSAQAFASSGLASCTRRIRQVDHGRRLRPIRIMLEGAGDGRAARIPGPATADARKVLTRLNEHARSLLSPPFALLLVTTAVIGLAFSTYFLLPTFLAVELGADAATIGGVSAVPLLVSVLFMPLAGVQIDHRGRRLFAWVGALLFALASAGMLFVDRVGPLLWTLRLLQGVGFPLFYVALSTLATDIAPRERVGQAIGLFGGVMIATNALGPALAEWGAQAFGWRAVFGATVVAALFAAVLARFLPDAHRGRSRAHASSLPSVLQRPGMVRVLGIAVMVGLGFAAMFTFHQPWALANGFEQVSRYLTGFAVAAMVVRLGLGGLADRLGRLRVAQASLLLYVLAPLSLVWLPTLGLLWTGGMLGLAHGLFYPALNAVAVDLARDDERGKAMAIYNGAFNLGFASGSYLLGYVARASGYPVVFLLATACCLLAFGLLATTARHPPPPHV